MKKIVRFALASMLLAGAVAAYAATLSTTTAGPPNDGVLQNFSGIDWNANGGGWVQGFDLTSANLAGDSDTFTFTYQAFASSIGTTSPTPNLYVASPGPAVGTYELTTYSVITETATCLTNGCASISITLNSGTWTTYFDITPDANQGSRYGVR